MADGLFNLNGKVALVTGSSRGLGFVMARGLAVAGARIILNGRDQAALDEAAAKLGREGVEAAAMAFDVTDSRQVDAALTRAEAEVGPVEILVNNVGIQQRAMLAEMTTDQFSEVIQANLTSAFIVTRRVVGGMIERRGGKIINICSVMSELGRATTGNYAASKGGLKMLTRAMAVEWAGYNVQANAIGPGYFLTEMTAPLAQDAKFDAWIKARTPAGRWGKPQELVGTAVFLASRASDFVNGQIIYVDGGILAAL